MNTQKQFEFLSKGTAFSIVLLFTALALPGLAFLPFLTVRLTPSAGSSSFTITTNWGNVSPTVLEAGVTSKLEGVLSRIPHIKKISSASSKGKSKITIELDKYAQTDKIRLEISTAIRRIYKKLPEGVSYPSINIYSPDNKSGKPLITYTLNGPDNGFVLQKYAENNIKTAFALISGIENTIVYGGTGFYWQITYDQDVIDKLDISTNDIKLAIYQFFKQQQVGFTTSMNDSLTTNRVRFNVILGKKFSDTLAWYGIPVSKKSDKIIYLRNICRVKRAQKQALSYFRINGQDAVNIVIYATKGSNALKTVKTVKTIVRRLKEKLPTGYKLAVGYDSTAYINNELAKIVKRTVLTLLILLAFVFLVSFNFKYVVVIVLSLFTNLALAFIFYYLTGVEIHLYSLAGITVSLGLIIDNSIVMTDHLLYRKNMRIYTALLASTLTTIGSLVVIWFLPSELKLKIWDFALILIINLLVSLIVALFYIPALFTLINITGEERKRKFFYKRLLVKFNLIYLRVIGFMLKYRIVFIVLLVLAFGLPFYMLPDKLESDTFPAKAYNKTFGSDWYAENARPIVNKYLGGTLRLFSYYVFENSYFTEPEETKLYVSASMPEGATIQQLNKVFIEMENFVSKFGKKIDFYSKIYGPQYAEMLITFKNKSKKNIFPYILKGKLISRSLDLGGVNWNIYGVGRGFSASTEVSDVINYKVALYGYNYDKLEDIARLFKKKLEVNPRVRKVNIAGNRYWWEQKKPYEYFADFNKNAVSLYHFHLNDVYNDLLNKSLQSGNRMVLFADNSFNEINLVPDYSDKNDKWAIFNVPTKTGYKLSGFINVHKEPEQQTVYKENQSYLRVVDFQYLGSSKFGSRHVNKVIKELKQQLPPGYRIKKLKDFGYQKKQVISYTLLILVISLIIFVLSAILFESLSRPFAIILTIPFSFIGVFLIFYLFDLNFDQGGYASFVLISGLVVNSAIYLLSEYDIVKAGNRSPVSVLYVKAFNRKIIPILLTIGSTVMGLIPFILFGKNEPFWFALAAGTIGGLIFSIVIILFYLPLFALKLKRHS